MMKQIGKSEVIHSNRLDLHKFVIFTSHCSWYKFDDDDVNPVETADVVTKDAYMLFYRLAAENNFWKGSAQLTKSVDS